jgi:hypothetical protein
MRLLFHKFWLAVERSNHRHQLRHYAGNEWQIPFDPRVMATQRQIQFHQSAIRELQAQRILQKAQA